MGKTTYQLVQDFSHQQHVIGNSTIEAFWYEVRIYESFADHEKPCLGSSPSATLVKS